MRQLSRSYLQHARRHLPEGSDPIPGLNVTGTDHVIWPINPIILPLSGIGNSGPYTSQSTSPPPNHWDTSIDSTRRNNFVLTYTGGGTGEMIWPIVCGPGDYTLWIDGGGTGTITAYIAGAYGPDARIVPDVLPGDWLLQSAWTLAASTPPYLRRIQDFCTHTGGGGATSGIGWTIQAVDDGVSTLYVKSTSIDTSGGLSDGLLNGGPGYFFFRLDVTPDFEVSEAIVQYNQP